MKDDPWYKIIYDIAMANYNVPYVWGGEKANIGFDCSGFIREILRPFNILPKEDLNSAMILDYFKHRDYRIQTGIPFEGCLVFFGSVSHVSHVMYCLETNVLIGATGGRSYCTSVMKAAALDARVKCMPADYRDDMVGFVDIFEKER